jgi:hypothetical protein
MLPYKFISEFMLAARVFVVWNCCNAAAAAEVALADAADGPLLAANVPSGNGVARCAAPVALEGGLARPLSVELIEISWSNWFNETN